MAGQKVGPRTSEELLELIQEEGELHLHRVVATRAGYSRWFLVTAGGSRVCGTDRCLTVHFRRGEVVS